MLKSSVRKQFTINSSYFKQAKAGVKVYLFGVKKKIVASYIRRLWSGRCWEDGLVGDTERDL